MSETNIERYRASATKWPAEAEAVALKSGRTKAYPWQAVITLVMRLQPTGPKIAS